MRRTEAHQGVRMIKFSSILSRYEARSSAGEAASYWDWRADVPALASAFEMRAKLACLIGGW